MTYLINENAPRLAAHLSEIYDEIELCTDEQRLAELYEARDEHKRVLEIMIEQSVKVKRPRKRGQR